MPSFGEYLKRERELREISLRAVSDETKISYRYLQALEEDNESKLPAEVFIKGFIRSYAGYIGLDPDEAILRYQEYQKTLKISRDVQRISPDEHSSEVGKKKSFNVSTFFIILALGGLLLFGGYRYWMIQGETSPDQSIVQSEEEEALPEPVRTEEEGLGKTQEPTETVPEKMLPAQEKEPSGTEEPEPALAPMDITLSALERTWLALDIDGREHYDITLQADEKIHFRMEETIRLTVGNAGGLVILYEGRTFGPLGEPGQVVKNFLLTRKDLTGDTLNDPAQQ
ncbi:MAG: RodZ domain-containing protein [Candidatus Hydrothermarchaeaceae archaeon]